MLVVNNWFQVYLLVGYVLFTGFNIMQLTFSFIMYYAFAATSYPLNHQRLSKKIVETKYGKMRGVFILPADTKLRGVEAFFGVPYARPPIGDLRFNPPKTPLSWEHVKIFDEMTPVCPQVFPNVSASGTQQLPRQRIAFIQRLLPFLRKQSEDCLYMNIYIPQTGKQIVLKYYNIQNATFLSLR